jgi:hypothetical protein
MRGVSGAENRKLTPHADDRRAARVHTQHESDSRVLLQRKGDPHA